MIRLFIRLTVWALAAVGAKSLYDKFAPRADRLKTTGLDLADRTSAAARDLTTKVSEATQKVTATAREGADDVKVTAQDAAADVRKAAADAKNGAVDELTWTNDAPTGAKNTPSD
jgi:gas vesicle protein